MADVAAADIVISMHSIALEEAHLAGRPIVQAVERAYPLPVDYRVLGVPLARDPLEVASRICERQWIPSQLMTEEKPTAAGYLHDLLSHLASRNEGGGTHKSGEE